MPSHPSSSSPSYNPPSPTTLVSSWPYSSSSSPIPPTTPFSHTIRSTFNIPDDDGYEYKSEGFSMTLARIQELMDTGTLKYYYRDGGGNIVIPPADIDAYISIFQPSTSTPKALKTFASNAKKGSPRSHVAAYLIAKRIFPGENEDNANSEEDGKEKKQSETTITIPRRKAPWKNPYFDIWAWTCHETGFIGPLDDPHYAHPSAAKQTHPMLPVLYHHFGCLCPSWEALNIIAHYARLPSHPSGVLDLGSGNGYWTHLLRLPPFSLPSVTAVDNFSSSYRYTYIPDTVHTHALDFLKQTHGSPSAVLLLVYPVTAARDLTRHILHAYRGDTIIIAGTQNANRFTAFADMTVEEFFETDEVMRKRKWKFRVRVALPSFAGKDEGLYVFTREM